MKTVISIYVMFIAKILFLVHLMEYSCIYWAIDLFIFFQFIFWQFWSSINCAGKS